jgi:hypothetical protein
MHIKNNDYFKNIDTQNKAYILGFIAADGHVSTKKSNKYVSIEISEKDVEILKFIKKEIGYDGTFGCKILKNRRYLRLRVYGEDFTNNVIKYGLGNLKTYRLELPTLPDDKYRHFIRGFFDGDGCIHVSARKSGIKKGKYRYQIVMLGAENFCNQLHEYILKTLGINFEKTIRITKRGTNLMYLRLFRIADIKKFMDYIYSNGNFYLKRKQKIFHKILKIHAKHNINTCKKITDSEVIEIRQRIKTGEVLRSIAKDYGVTHGAIAGIKSGKSYSYV